MSTKATHSVRWHHLFLFATLIVGSCETPEPRFDNQVYGCHAQFNWNEDTTRIALLGSWQLENIRCPFTEQEVEELMLTFREDSTLIMSRGGGLEMTIDWSLEVYAGEPNVFTLETEPIVGETLGRLFICEAEIVFSSSHLDGCDKLFTRR